MTDFGPMNMRDPRSDPLSPEYSGWATDELSPDDSDVDGGPQD